MADESFQEKTEKATPRKREESRKKGQVARSTDLNGAIILLVGTFVLVLLSVHLLHNLVGLFRTSFGQINPNVVDRDSVLPLLIQFVTRMATLVGPLFAVLVVVGVAVNVAQIGFLLTFEPLVPNFEKLNIVKGLKSFVSVKSLAELVKGLAKLGIIVLVGYFTLSGRFEEVLRSGDYTVAGILVLLGKSATSLAVAGGFAMLVLAAADFFFQRWQFERSLRMTKEEVKQEQKQTDGDPQIKARVRAVQRDIARKRMMSKVPEADVIITNPVHLAVALKYDPQEMTAPMVIAKGARKLAERIKEIAQEHAIPIVEDRSLAQLLYRHAEVGEEIPVDAYRAVAEILGHIYRLTGKVQ